MIKKLFFILLVIVSQLVSAQSKKEENKDKSKKKVNYALMPVIMYNRSFGGQFGVMANAYFDVSQKDTISPASSIAFMGNVFTNKTLFTGIFSKFYFKEDQWRTKFALGYGDIKFQTYYEVPDGIPQVWAEDENGEFVDYQTKMAFVYTEGTRLVVNNLYLGLRMVFSHVNTTFDSDLLPEETLGLFGFGLASEFDNRNSVFTPNRGMNGKIRTFSYLESMGSSNTYHRINVEYNKYFSLGKKAIILARFYGAISAGDSIPFSGMNVVGRDDLRGYTDGKYRANQVYNIQSEYRWNFYKKWGMVAFAGIAVATDNFKGDNYSGVLSSAGAGLRFMAIPSRRINIGVDAAIGKDDWGVYFRIGETFTK
jgi:hypothetical protein